MCNGYRTYLSRRLGIIRHLFLALSRRQTLLVELFLKLPNHADRPRIVPDNCAAERFPRLLVPTQGRFSLIGDADTLHGRGAVPKELEFLRRARDAFCDAVDEILRFVFVPIGVRIMLRVLGLMLADDFGVLVKDDEAGRCRAAVDAPDEFLVFLLAAHHAHFKAAEASAKAETGSDAVGDAAPAGGGSARGFLVHERQRRGSSSGEHRGRGHRVDIDVDLAGAKVGISVA